MNTKILGLGTLKFYKYVVVITEQNGQLLLCRQKNKTTWEFPGGHIELKEKPLDAAKRELREETGAVEFTIKPLFDYWTADDVGENGGVVFYAQVTALGKLPDYEMEQVRRFEALPEKLSYPKIQPELLEEFYRLKRLGKA